MSKDAILARFKEILKDPYGSIDRWKDSYKGFIGYFLPHAPEEMILSAGFLPIALLAENTSMTSFEGSYFLPGICCSYMRNIFEMSVNKKFEKLLGVVVPVVCDSTRVLADIWKKEVSFPFYEVFHVPRKIKGLNVKEFYKGELNRFKVILENYTGNSIKDEQLRESIKIYNKNREILKKLYDLRVEYPSLLSNRELFVVIKCAMLMPKEIHTRWVSELLEALEEEKASLAGQDDQFIRVIAVGKLWEPAEILDLLDSKKVVIAGDNFCVGYSYLEGSGKDNSDPYYTLIDSQLKQMSMFAGYVSPRKDRERSLLRLIEQTGAKGAIFFLLKYCELLSFDYPGLRKALENSNIPVVAIETDLNTINTERIKTQIEAFLEIIKGDLHYV